MALFYTPQCENDFLEYCKKGDIVQIQKNM